MVGFTTEILEAFWAKVDKNGPVPVGKKCSGNCWLWTATVNKNGYGLFFRVRTVLAHRLSWCIAFGEPGTLQVNHACDNPPCVNPEHLWIGTQAENLDDMMKKGRHGSITCPDKHAYGDANGTRQHPEKLARGDAHGSRTHPEKLPRGETHWKSKFSETDVQEIRKQLALGVTQKFLAQQYNVAQTAISKIKTGKTWRHV